MIIAFDTMLLSRRYRNSGIYEYAKNLFSQFRGLLQADGSMGIRHFVSSGYSDDSMDWNSTPAFKAVNTSLLKYHRLWRLGVGSLVAARARADVIFSPGPTILPSQLLPVVVTIHDAMPVRLPADIVPKSSLSRMATWVSAKWSHKVLTDSEHSRRDLIDIYDLPPEKVSVVYLGYNHAIFNSLPTDLEKQAALLARLGIKRPFILHHGMVQLRKNLGRLIDAFGTLRARKRNLDTQLVLAGNFGWGAKELLQSANGSVRKGDIVFTGPLPDEELALLIKAATLCVIPSLYEGFCLPMVESMACGIPTIASNTSCIPEVSGGVLRYFNPLDVEDIASNIEECLEDTELREDLVCRGLNRASEFSWRRCALETLAALKEFNERNLAPELIGNNSHADGHNY